MDEMKSEEVVIGLAFKFEVCDMQRLWRFLILGAESNTYNVLANSGLENIICVRNLLDAGHHVEVLNLVEEYSRNGRCPREEPILMILAFCAVHSNPVIRKAAYNRVNSICNIPTKLFRFLELTQTTIYQKIIQNPPEPQPRIV